MPYTRFERARLLGARALQVAMGAPPLVAVEAPDALIVATAEWSAGLVPITTVRVRDARD